MSLLSQEEFGDLILEMGGCCYPGSIADIREARTRIATAHVAALARIAELEAEGEEFCGDCVHWKVEKSPRKHCCGCGCELGA